MLTMGFLSADLQGVQAVYGEDFYILPIVILKFLHLLNF